MRQRSLATRVFVFALVVAVIVAAIFIVFLLAISSLQRSREREAHSKDVAAATLGLETLVGDLETGIRGYVITGKPAFLEPWKKARREWLPAALRLQRLVANDPRQERQTRAVRGEIEHYITDFGDLLIGIAVIDPASARDPETFTVGKQQTDAIRSKLDSILAVEKARSAERAAAARTLTRRAELIGISGLALSALLVLLFGAWVLRAVGHPLQRVADGATAVAAGDLSVRLQEGGAGEIGALTRAFNSMTRALEAGRLELMAQNERLRESERHKSELISMVSHELRTPLASVLGFTALLLRRDFGAEERRRYLEIVDAEARRLAALAEDFLDVQLLEEGRFELSLEPLDVAELVREQARLFFAHTDDHRFELDGPTEPVVVQADHDRLAQVVGNLLSNAIKYSPAGGAVRVEVVPHDGHARIAVYDEGIGIPSSHRDRIFEKFYRGAAPTAGISGTGLGLAVAREIVEAHGGALGFESEDGVGSTFWFELPLSTAAATEPEPESEPRTAEARP